MLAPQPTLTVDDADFHKTFSEYIKWNKRLPAEIVNAKLYFIALQSCNYLEQHYPRDGMKSKIRNSLAQPAIKYPRMTLGEVLTISNLRKRGRLNELTSEKTANGGRFKSGKFHSERLAKAVERFTRNAERGVGFLQVGWWETLKVMDFWNRKNQDNVIRMKRFGSESKLAVKFGSVKQKAQMSKVPKGFAKPALLDHEIVYGITTSFAGLMANANGQHSRHVAEILTASLGYGIKQEIASMKYYIDRTMDQKFREMKSASGGGII